MFYNGKIMIYISLYRKKFAIRKRISIAKFFLLGNIFPACRRADRLAKRFIGLNSRSPRSQAVRRFDFNHGHKFALNQVLVLWETWLSTGLSTVCGDIAARCRPCVNLHDMPQA